MDAVALGDYVGCDMCNWFFGIYSQVYDRRIRFFSNDRTREGFQGKRRARQRAREDGRRQRPHLAGVATQAASIQYGS